LHPKFELLEKQHLRLLLTVKLETLCTRAIMRGVQPVYDDSDIRAVKTANLRNGYLDWSEAQTVDEDFYEANQRRAGVRKGDVLIASTGTGSLGKVDFYNDDTPALADGHVAIVRVDPKQFDPCLLSYVLRSRVAQWQIEQQLAGATNQIEIYSGQLAALRLPELDQDQQRELLRKVIAIESKISAARARLRQPTDIINEILCEAFRYPLSEHRKRERERQFTRQLSDFGAGFTLRSSVKFHHPDYELTDTFFAHMPHERVKAYLAVPIRLGISLTRAVMDNDGEAFYVHPNALKRQERVDPKDCHRITLDYYEKNKRRSGLRVGDVLINRSGEALGKVGLFDSDEPCVFSDFTMRVRFNDRMNPLFAWYFFRSIMFQSQVEREKRGLSLPNIFPSQVAELRIVAIDRTRQDSLADEIAAVLEALQHEREDIEARRQEIENLVEAALILVANCPTPPGTPDVVRPIPTEECGFCEFTTSINTDTGGEFTLYVFHAPTPRVPQRRTDVFWPEAFPQAMPPPALY
jgi:restriction endonuclease S subunit